jgi:hypothetical protein
MQTWTFQGNPDEYDMDGYLRWRRHDRERRVSLRCAPSEGPLGDKGGSYHPATESAPQRRLVSALIKSAATAKQIQSKMKLGTAFLDVDFAIPPG